MQTIKVQQRGTLTLPKKIRTHLNLEEGSVLRIAHTEGKIVLEKVSAQAPELLHEIKQALAELKEGDFIEFGSVPEFKRKLKRYDAD